MSEPSASQPPITVELSPAHPIDIASTPWEGADLPPQDAAADAPSASSPDGYHYHLRAGDGATSHVGMAEPAVEYGTFDAGDGD